jgi:hypothetical protein
MRRLVGSSVVGLVLAGSLTVCAASSAALGSGTTAPTGPGVRSGSRAPDRTPAGWTVPVKVIPAHIFTFGLSMAVDASGHIDLVVAGYTNSSRGVWYATNRTGTWHVTKVLKWSLHRTWIDPSIALSDTGRVYISLDRTDCVECTVGGAHGVYLISDVGRAHGTFPSTPTRLTPEGTSQGSLAWSEGHLYLAFAGDPDHGPTPVQMATNVSGHWTTRGVGTKGVGPAIAIGADGFARIVFVGANGLRYAAATTHKGQFNLEIVPGTTAADRSPRLAINAFDLVNVAWIRRGSTDKARFAQHSPSGWGVQASLGKASATDAAVTNDGAPHVLTSNSSVREHVLHGSTFTSAIVDSSDPGAPVAIATDPRGGAVAAWNGTAGVWVASN